MEASLNRGLLRDAATSRVRAAAQQQQQAATAAAARRRRCGPFGGDDDARAEAGTAGAPMVGQGLQRALAVADQAHARAAEVGARERRLKERRDAALQNTMDRPAGVASHKLNAGVNIFGAPTNRSKSV